MKTKEYQHPVLNIDSFDIGNLMIDSVSSSSLPGTGNGGGSGDLDEPIDPESHRRLDEDEDRWKNGLW